MSKTATPVKAEKAKKPAAPVKPATKAAAPAKTAAKPLRKVDATAAVAAALSTPPVDAKAARAAERAARYPDAAAKEAAKGKTVRQPGEAKPAKAEKVAKATVAFVARAMKKGQPIHVLSINSRPVSGSRLAAHTHAALTILGMLDATCPAVPASSVRTVMGDRAIAYHTKEVNFETGPDHTLRLTPAGRNKFLSRSVDGGLANAFVSMFLDGKVDPAIGVAQGQIAQVVL